MTESKLQTDIKFLAGVGPKKAALLKSDAEVQTFEDLLYYYPYKYIDRTEFHKISDVNADMPYVQLRGKITSFQTAGDKKNPRLVAHFTDNTGMIELVWFKGIKWIQDTIKKNVEYIVFGKPTEFRGDYNISHPDIEEAAKVDSKLASPLEPAYNTTEKMKTGYLNSKTIFKLICILLPNVKDYIQETLPNYIIQQCALLPLKDALWNIHLPQNLDSLRKAEYRLKFEEFFYVQLKILGQKKYRTSKLKGFVFSKVADNFNNFYNNNLPFDLTDAQKRVIKEMRKAMATGKQMNRLLQGDVGSGKTLVALMSMLIAMDNGFQSAIMAPTEILANQHFETITKFLKNININVRMLTGSTKTKERRDIHEQLLSGEINILIGTHALIEDIVQFKNLGLVVVDEQHKFGVAQRAKLWSKNENPPHVIVMTATPIPRTLAMTLYGDLDISVIDELPAGRKPIQTKHFFEASRLQVFGFMRKQIEAGRQIYVVYPLINESEKMDLKNLNEGYEQIIHHFPAPKYAVSIVHGQMKAEDKEIAMQYFVKGITHIMIATTVIEVGVNVPNASVMIIESAQRFGLSQLHQLRGRVGRGAEQSYCVLMTPYEISKEARKRMKIMEETNDGFKIAEMDLKLRGPGDIDGTQQSGLPINFKIASLANDGDILQLAREIAYSLLEQDENLEKQEHQVLKKQLQKIKNSTVEWGNIG